MLTYQKCIKPQNSNGKITFSHHLSWLSTYELLKILHPVPYTNYSMPSTNVQIQAYVANQTQQYNCYKRLSAPLTAPLIIHVAITKSRLTHSKSRHARSKASTLLPYKRNPFASEIPRHKCFIHYRIP